MSSNRASGQVHSIGVTVCVAGDVKPHTTTKVTWNRNNAAGRHNLEQSIQRLGPLVIARRQSRLEVNMPDVKLPLEPPPSYEDAAAEHTTNPPSAGGRNITRAPIALDLPVIRQLGGKRVILASASPRRKQLLAQVCLVILEITAML